jgi:outer membrane protein assembly factor BamD
MVLATFGVGLTDIGPEGTQVLMNLRGRSLVLAGLAVVVLGLGLSACAAKKKDAAVPKSTQKADRHKKGVDVPQGMLEADRFLYQRGQEYLTAKKWIKAREHFQKIVENYPQSAYRPDAKLGIGDTYIGENSIESLILGQNEFKEFLTFYPTNARADYAQYRVGYGHYKQMRSPERDQTDTREAIAEWETFVERYPQSAYMNECREKLREAKDRLGDAEYRVGLYYYRVKWYAGAIERFKGQLTLDPEYTRRDAVYYHLAGSLEGVSRAAEALPYYDKLLREFPKSQYLKDTQSRVEAIKAAEAAPQKPAEQPKKKSADKPKKEKRK